MSDPYLPPGCTQWECDYAAGGYDEPPQRWYECVECGGEGHIEFAITVYEAGCGFPHGDTDSRICTNCNGAGGHVDDVEPDQQPRRG